MNWQEVTACIAAVMALGSFYKWISDRQEAHINSRLDAHHEYQKEKFDEMSASLEDLKQGQSEHASKLADHATRIAIVETRLGPLH